MWKATVVLTFVASAYAQSRGESYNGYRPQQRPISQGALTYPAEVDEHFQSPTDQNNYYPQYQQYQPNPWEIFRPVQPAIETTPFRVNGRLSQRKCDEFSKFATKKVLFGSLSFGSSAQDISSKKCDAVTGLIVGGTNAAANEFPHQAAIGYPNSNGNIEFKCGGSLISELFVLTAAHCRKFESISSTTIRLGELNMKERDFGQPEVDIPIEEFIVHKGFTRATKENDIAVVKMRQAATFSKSIRPACLQQTENIGKTSAIATGWGSTDYDESAADILQKVQLEIISNDRCKSIYEDFFDSQICAGALEGGRDTCNGDSGGPLQTKSDLCIYTIIGLTSYGSPFCGAKNSAGVYTRVSAYLDWIESKVWSDLVLHRNNE